MRILITGGAGFIGSHLCDFLLERGHEVICMDNLITGNMDNIAHLFGRKAFSFVQHDVTNYIYVAGDLDYILHFASPASPKDYLHFPIQTLKVGALGTHKALGLAKAKKAKFLLASTSECYGDPLVHPQPEDYWGNVNPIGVRGVYDEAKRFAEAMTMAYHRYHGIDTKIVRIFNSVLADERVMLFNEGELHITTAEEYARELEQKRLIKPEIVHVPAFDPETGTLSLHRARAFIAHPSLGKDAYRVKTRYGREICVTGDHSLFKRGKDSRPVAVPVRSLKVGDYIAIPGRLPMMEQDVTDFNIAEHLIAHASSADELWNYALVTPELRRVVTEHEGPIYDILMASSRFDGSRRKRNTVGCIYRRYRREGTLPLYLWARLRQYVPLSWPEGAKIRPYKGGGGTAIPGQIVVSDDLLWLLGLYLAEGTIFQKKGTHFISLCSDDVFLNRAKSILEGIFGVRVGLMSASEKRGPTLYVHSKLLCYVFDRMSGLDGSSRERHIPTWILQLPLNRVQHFLEGYRQGDGTHSGLKVGNELCFDTISRKLALDLVVLLLRFGIVASLGQYETTFKKKYGERRFPFYRVTICELSDFNVLNWAKGVKQTLNAVRWGDLVWVPIRAIEACETTSYVYDFIVPGVENFIAGSGVCTHNTYGPRMRKDDGRAIPTFITQALSDEDLTVFGDGSQTRSICYISDLVDGIYRLMHSEVDTPVNLGNPEEMTILKLAQKIIEIAESRSQITFKPLPQDDPKVRRPDISKARNLLGWEPSVSADEGLRSTVTWFKGQTL